MDKAIQHWEILQELGTDLANRVREFLVIGWKGEGVIVATEDGQGFWLGQMEFGCYRVESRIATRLTPLDIPDLVHMAQGCTSHILLLNKRGEIYSMGRNNCGQLGLGTVDGETYFSPQLILSPHKFISVRCGGCHCLALTDDGKVWAWGANFVSQVGVPSSTDSIPSPRQISELDPHRVVSVECGGHHSLALTDRGEVYSWGWNDCGQLGAVSANGHLYVNYRKCQHTPTRIPTSSPVQSMAAGFKHTLLLTQTGEVWACGDNEFGQLGPQTTTQSNLCLSKVAGLPSISQIATHTGFFMSIAMSSDQRCFVWGRLNDGKLDKKYINISTPRELSSFYSTVDSPLSFYSRHRSTPHSVTIPETPPSPLSVRMSRMFYNPETSPDVQFVVEQRTIHAHRCILSNSSDYFAGMFSERWMAPVDSVDPIVRVTITDHSYPVFHAFLHFLYTDCLDVNSDLLPKMFDLASLYFVPDLQQLCLSRMRTTLTPTTCCLYYPLTQRHSLLPELATFQQELVQFASTRMSEVVHSAAYHSMEPDLRDQLTNAAFNLPGTCTYNWPLPLNPPNSLS